MARRTKRGGGLNALDSTLTDVGTDGRARAKPCEAGPHERGRGVVAWQCGTRGPSQPQTGNKKLIGLSMTDGNKTVIDDITILFAGRAGRGFQNLTPFRTGR